MDDRDSVRAAFDGVYGAFVVTNYWAPLEDGDGRNRSQRESAQARNAALAAKDAGVEHVVWSTLEDTRGVLAGRVPLVDEFYTVPHFDVKAEADDVFREADVPTTFLRTTLFFDGFADTLGPRRDEAGRLVLSLPIADARMSGIAVADIGKVAAALFLDGQRYVGRTVNIAGEHLTGRQYADALGDALGEPVSYEPLDWDRFRAQDFPGAVEMGNMFQFYAEDTERFVGDRDLDAVRALDPQLQSFRDWLRANGNRIQKG